MAEVLRSQGIAVATPGSQHRAMLGMLGAYVSIQLQVPDDRADEARALVAAFGLQGNAPAAVSASQPQPERVRSIKVAVGAAILGAAALMSTGLGHLYAGQRASAAVLLIAGWACLLSALRGSPLWVALPLLALGDVVGAVLSLRGAQRGRPGQPLVHTALIGLFAYAALTSAPSVSTALDGLRERPAPATPRPRVPDIGGMAARAELPRTARAAPQRSRLRPLPGASSGDAGLTGASGSWGTAPGGNAAASAASAARTSRSLSTVSLASRLTARRAPVRKM